MFLRSKLLSHFEINESKKKTLTVNWEKLVYGIVDKLGKMFQLRNDLAYYRNSWRRRGPCQHGSSVTDHCGRSSNISCMKPAKNNSTIKGLLKKTIGIW